MRKADIAVSTDAVIRPKEAAPGVLGIETSRTGQRSRWVEVRVARDDAALEQILGVCGYDEFDVPVTSFSLLGPFETATYVEAWSRVDNWRVTTPSFSDREDAALAFHLLSGLYGGSVTDHPIQLCECIYPLGYAWRWWEAVDVEACVLSTMRRPLVEVEVYSSEVVSL